MSARWPRVHRYFFILIALNIELDLPHEASISNVVEVEKDHVLAYGVYMGVYSRR